jgi:hypothetical protein
MEVYSQVNANRTYFSGLSTDTKPTITVQPGAIFIETDTNNKYIYTSSGTWVLYFDKTGLLDSSGNGINSSNGILFTAAYIWQPSTLSYIHASADASGNLNVTGSGGGGGGSVTQGTIPWQVSQYGTWTTGRTWTLASGTDSVTIVPSGTQTVSGSVSVSNFPATQPVSGSVSVSNFPATQPVSGTVAATQSGTWTIANTSFASTQSGTWTVGLSAGSNAIGSITNTSFASTQSGTWTVGLSAGSNAIGSITNTSFASTQSGTWVVNTKNALTSNSPTAASVGITSAQAVASNANRKGLVLTNTSSANISLGFGAAAVLNSGITLYPGGTFNMDEYSFTTAAINAIASVAASNLGIQEWQ